MINIGNDKITDIYCGSHKVIKAYKGNVLVYEAITVLNTYSIGSVNSTDVTATLYSNGLLKFTGSGEMKQWETPTDIKSYVKEVYMGEGINAENIKAIFKNCTNLEKINKFPDPNTTRTAVTSIESAFEGCIKLRKAPDILNGWCIKLSCFSGCVNIEEEVNVWDACDPYIVNAAQPTTLIFYGNYTYNFPIYINYTQANYNQLKMMYGEYGSAKNPNIFLGRQLD